MDNQEKPKIKPRLRQKKFAKILATRPVSPAQAVLEVYGGRKDNANDRAAILLAKPHVMENFVEELAKNHPGVPGKMGNHLVEIMDDKELSPLVRIKAIETLAKIAGITAPTKSVSIKANVDQTFKLPGD